MILDTNALSAIAEGNSRAVPEFARARQIEIPVIALGEYRFGIGLSRRRRTYERWLDQMLSLSRILPVDEDTASAYAEIRAELRKSGTPIPTNDAWIAALCRQHGLPLLSQDRHFDMIKGLERIGW